MLDAISRSVPELLWLTELDQKGAEMTLQGRCMAMTSISDFVDNLGRTGWFARPVEIVDSQVESGQASGADVIKFTVRAQVATPAG